MANSNVSSAAYRAASGWKNWGRVSQPNNHITVDAPKPAHIVEYIKDNQDREDSYQLQKAELRATLEEGYDESLVTVVKEGKRSTKAKENRKKVLTQRKKRETIRPTKKLNRKERRALENKVRK